MINSRLSLFDKLDENDDMMDLDDLDFVNSCLASRAKLVLICI